MEKQKKVRFFEILGFSFFTSLFLFAGIVSADGSVTSLSCGDTIFNDTVLNGSLISCPWNGLSIGANNIKLDCAGFAIEAFNTGVVVSNVSGVMIENCDVQGQGGGGAGIYLESAPQVIIRNNSFSGEGYGVLATNSNSSFISNNSVIDSVYGIYIEYGSHNSKISDNFMKLKEFREGIFITNSSLNVTVSNNNISQARYGIYIEYGSHNATISDNFLTDNYAGGIRISRSSHVKIYKNFLEGSLSGAEISLSPYTEIYNNTAINNSRRGIIIESGCDNTTISGNNLLNNLAGVVVSFSSNLLVWGNNFSNNSDSNAYELTENLVNSWNLSDVGNYWDDFESNLGYPNYYEVPGPAGGTDYHPIWEFVGLDISEFSVVYQNALERVFRFVVNNTLESGMEDIWWSLDVGDGNKSSQMNVSLDGGEDLFVYVYHNYSSSGNFTVVARAQNQIYNAVNSIEVVI